ncbi:MAG: hypothetical protein DVB25_00355 [Verrucomicrobia bacterium]|nr:MAG: hypothetical protein DVB25_00355 [Verrucomicrobiota bacterium]
MQKNLILTTASGLTASQLRPFVFSFQQFQKEADLVIFTNRLNAETRRYLSESAQLIDFKHLSIRMRHPQCFLWPLWKRGFPLLKTEHSRRQLGRFVFNLASLRFLLYLEYLENLTEKPAWVFLTDSRDAIFQDDLFARIEGPGLYCFGEGKQRTIAGCYSNSAMLKDCAGEQALKEYGQREPSCAGTILGDYESMLNYLQTTVRITMSVERMKMVSSVDQGVHNYITHKELIPNTNFVDNDAGPIGTMGSVAYNHIRESPEHLILQSDGRPYAFLHQQDRHKQIVENHPVYKQIRNL